MFENYLQNDPNELKLIYYKKDSKTLINCLKIRNHFLNDFEQEVLNQLILWTKYFQ